LGQAQLSGENMPDAPSFQDLLNDFADEIFVGRGEQLTLFESAIKASQPAFLILNISGQGGVGKTTLLERYCQISKNNEVAYASVTEDHLAIPKILEVFVSQLKEDGLDFDTFTERHRKYLELKEKVESDPKVPSGLMDFALRGITRVGVKSLKRIPVAGDVADVFLSPESEEIIAEQASEFTKYIFQKFTNKDERVLLLDTDAELTRYFLEDITKALKNKKAVLCFDTYEKTSDSIEKWLVNLLHGGYGRFSSNILFVVAGRYSLGQNWTRFRRAIRLVELKEFTEEEAKDYLERSGITDEKLVSQFIEITKRLPVLLALLVSSPNQLPHDMSGDAVQRFLQGLTPEQQEAALISSLPRYFNSDILTSIFGDEEGKKAFQWLSKANFVRTSENGWVYHDVVRVMMTRYLRMRSNQQFVEVHKHLEEYYQEQITNFLGDADVKKFTDGTSKFEAEKIYHFLCQNPIKKVEILVKLFAATLWVLLVDLFEDPSAEKNTSESFGFLTTAYSSSLFQLCDEISDLTTKEQLDNFRNLAEFLSDGSTKEPKLFDWLLNVDILNDQEKSMLFLLRANILEINEKNNDSALALNDFNKVIQLNPSLAMGYSLRGNYHQDNKKYELALSDISKAIELYPKHRYIYNRRGQMYKEMKDYPAALTDFSKSIELQPENGANYYWRGQTHLNMEDYPNALTDFSKSIELQPENGDNYNWRGLTYYQMKDYPNTLIDFSKAIELQSENRVNYYNRGRTHLNMEDYPNALTDFSKSIELQPENGDNYNWRGLTYYQMKDYPAALIDFSKAIELQSENRVNYYNRGRTHLNMEDYPNALTDFSKSIELQPENGDNYNWRGQTHFNMEDYPNALTDFSKSIELQPENVDNYNWRGLTYYQMKDYPAALTDFSKSIELQPENGDNYFWRGQTYYQMKDYPAALTDFSKSIELQPENGDNYFWRGQTYYQMKDYPNTLIDFSKAIELQLENGDNYYWRGRTYYQMKDYPAAFIDFSKAIELQSEDGFNYYRRALCQHAMSNQNNYKEDAQIALQLLRAEQEQSKESITAFRIALCLLAIQETEKAKIFYEETIGQCSEKDTLEYALENLKEFIELIGSSPETQYIEDLFNVAVSK
jgi:tetratricopeptide (TPR) repeat protein